MPTSITIPVPERTKSIQFGAAYSPSESFNPDKKLMSAGGGRLSGLTLTVDTGPVPPEITVAPGVWMHKGIIVQVTTPQTVQFPNPQVFPLYLVAENANEMSNSAAQYLFTTTPNADSAILASWTSLPLTTPTVPGYYSLAGLRDAIGQVSGLVIQRERIVAGGGQTVFPIPGPKAYVVGANKLLVYRNGKKLENINDYAEDSPTQFTLLFGATGGDIFDLIIIQGALPITSLGLPNLTDVTSDLSNAIKDSLALRAVPASPSNPLATLADIVGTAGSVGALQKTEVLTVSGSYVTGLTPLVVGAPANFVLPVNQTVAIDAFLSNHYHPGSANRNDGQIGIRLDGVDHWGGRGDTSGLGYFGTKCLSITRAFFLAAGAHTAEIIIRAPNNFATNVAPSTDVPACLRVLYTTPQAMSPSPFPNFASAVKTSGNITVNLTSLTDVPGPFEVTINTAGGDVLIEVEAYANGGAGNNVIGLGLKIDGVEQSDVPNSQEVGISPMGCLGATVNGYVGFKWLAPALAPGSHTFRLTAAVGSGSGVLRCSPQRPIRMFVWYP